MFEDSILITGGCGFIGSNFILSLFNQRHTPVVNLDLQTYASDIDNLSCLKHEELYRFVHGDICNTTLVRHLLQTQQPQTIVHFAAASHVDRSITDPSEFIRTNINGTANLLKEATKYYNQLKNNKREKFCFIHVSTDEVYGSLALDEPPFTTTSAYQPNNPYAASKASADHIVRSYHITYGLPVITTHSSNNYGPNQHVEKLIPSIITNALTGKQIQIYGNGSNIRDWIFVQDHCNALMRCMDAKKYGAVYNIGGNCEQTNLQIAHTICKMLDDMCPPTQRNLKHHKTGKLLDSYSQLICFTADRSGHDYRYAIDINKISNELGWLPQVNLASGLEKTIHWYIKKYRLLEIESQGVA